MRYTITFFIDKEADKPDGRLRCRIRWQRNSLAFLVGYRVNPDRWSQDAQRCTKNSTHGKEAIPAHIINAQIEKIENVIRDTFLPYTLDNVPDKAEVKAIIDKKIFRDPANTPELNEYNILSVYKAFLDEYGFRQSWSKGTKKKYSVFYTHFEKNWPNLDLRTLPDNFPQTFSEYFINHGYNNNSTKRYVRHLFTFLRWAQRKNLYNGAAIHSFDQKIKTLQREVVYLTWDELMLFMNYQIPPKKNYLANVRDIFCFCCMTGLRYSDATNLKWHNVHDTHIKIVTQKTSAPLTIELNKYSQSILANTQKQPHSDLVFRKISDQKANVYLKELAALAGINDPVSIVKFVGSQRVETTKPKHEYITTHVARRTFVVNALTLGIPAEVVMAWTGHSDYDSMKPYIAIVDDLKKQSMAKFDTLEAKPNRKAGQKAGQFRANS